MVRGRTGRRWEGLGIGESWLVGGKADGARAKGGSGQTAGQSFREHSRHCANRERYFAVAHTRAHTGRAHPWWRFGRVGCRWTTYVHVRRSCMQCLYVCGVEDADGAQCQLPRAHPTTRIRKLCVEGAGDERGNFLLFYDAVTYIYIVLFFDPRQIRTSSANRPNSCFPPEAEFFDVCRS